MTILLHALGATIGGAVRHLTNFLPALVEADRDRQYVVIVRDTFPDLAVGANIRVLRVASAVSRVPLARVITDVVGIPALAKRLRVSMVVSLTNFGPVWSGVPHILFQRNMLYYCAPHLLHLDARELAPIPLRRRLAFESMKRATTIVTPSHAMRNAIRRMHPVLPEDRFRILYHGFTKCPFHEVEAQRLLKVVSQSNGVRILYPTHAAPHKGFDVLFDIASRLKAQGLVFTLILTISREDAPREMTRIEHRIRRLGLSDVVLNVGNVPQSQIGALYEACDLMVYPSLCESFGFSMLEAMHHGLPIVAADTETNREICAGAAVYYDPLNANAGCDAVLNAIDGGTCRRLRAEAATRVSSFDWSWNRYAREFVQLIESANGSA